MTVTTITSTSPDLDEVLDRVDGYAEEVCDLDDVGRDRWLQLRQAGLGGSDSSKVLGVDRYGSPLSVYADKLDPDTVDENARMEWGRRLEDAVASKLAEDLDVDAVDPRKMWRHPDHPCLLVTPDRISSDGAIFEIKTTSSYRAEDWAGSETDGLVPNGALVQGLHGLAVTGLDRVHFGVLIDGWDFRRRTVERDDDLLADIVQREISFWADHIEARVPPPADQLEATTRALARLYRYGDGAIDLTGEYVDGLSVAEALDHRTALCARIDELEEEVAAINNGVKALLGDNDVGTVDGLRAVTWRNDVNGRRRFSVTVAWKKRNEPR